MIDIGTDTGHAALMAALLVATGVTGIAAVLTGSQFWWFACGFFCLPATAGDVRGALVTKGIGDFGKLPIGDCHDCRRELFLSDDYWVHSRIWEQAGMGRGKLCIECLESRLGRELMPNDFARLTHDFVRAEGIASPVLRSRVLGWHYAVPDGRLIPMAAESP